MRTGAKLNKILDFSCRLLQGKRKKKSIIIKESGYNWSSEIFDAIENIIVEIISYVTGSLVKSKPISKD